MHKCINGSDCTEVCCSEACNLWSETSYLMGRNNIKTDRAIDYDLRYKNHILKFIRACEDSEYIICRPNCTFQYQQALTMMSIGMVWKANAHKCSVYTLNFADYLDSLKISYGGINDENFGYKKIWAQSSQILIIHGLDYISYGLHEFTTLFQLIESRQSKRRLTFILLRNSIDSLKGKGDVLSSVQDKLKEVRYRDN